MRVPLAWLRAHCDPGLPAAEIAERLAMTGTEVERLERVGVGDPGFFVVGKVLEAARHPNADRLSVCRVDDGSGEPRTIVCGAPNVAPGQTVALALPGAVMPDGSVLGEAKLRGVRSSGMILAEDEVGIGPDHGGIMVLDPGLHAGRPLIEALPIADEVLELEITPNRPDCLGVYGVARELHAATGAPLAPDPTDEDAPPSGDDRAEDHASIEIADPEICLRFTARVFEDVTIRSSPLWLKERLTAAGQRPISNVVDITNYVMLETGQPMHAFDLDRVRGRQVIVRRAQPGETLTTLDGAERTLEPSMALVGDAEGSTSIAGIMGGQVSEVSEETTRVLMEAATWVGPNILKTSARLGLRSEASARYEKQLHPDQAMAGQRLAARLMVELCGARLVPGTLDEYPAPAPAPRIALRLHRVAGLLGSPVPAGEVRAILERLAFGVSDVPGGFEVEVPPFRRADVQREADLIEEIARIHGLERLPITLPARRAAVGGLTPWGRLRRRLEDALVHRGLQEVVAWSFTAPETLARLRLGGPPLALANPLSEDQSVLRPLLLPGLLDAARFNAARGRTSLSLFESAHVYAPRGGNGVDPDHPRGGFAADERHHLAALITQAVPATWRRPGEEADFYAVRALVEAVLASVGVAWSAVSGERPYLHPGRTATVLGPEGRQLGWIGELHPQVAEAWDLDGGAAFELDADALAEVAPGPADFRDITAFPSVRQDIAVVVAEGMAASELVEAVHESAGALLETAEVFDLYRGEQLGEGRKSLALRLEFRAPDRTLTDEEIAELRARIEGRLSDLGGALRA